jgi:hypothetical protein
VDFIPYEGAPLARGNELRRTSLVVAITAVILAGAGWLAVLTPVSNVGSFDEGLGEAPGATVAMTAPVAVASPSLVAGAASSDSDFGPGGAESELACQAASSKVALRRQVSAPKHTALAAVHPKLAAR